MPDLLDRRAVLGGLACLPLATTPAALRAETGKERTFNLRVVMSGHSLTDPLPHPLSILVQAAGGPKSRGMVIDRSTIPGSTAKLRWINDMNLPVYARRDIARYDVLVLTERVPVRSAIEWEESVDYTQKWFDHAWSKGKGGKGAETIYYASWVDIRSGPGNTDEYDMPDERLIPLRERLDLEMGAWQQVADQVNAHRAKGSPRMRVIPGPKIMAAVLDAISAGTAPGLTRIKDLFEDTIHPNAKGAYLMAVAHYAVIYGRDPRTLPNLRGEPGWPSAKQADWMKELVWDVLRSYPDSGLT
ncbi:hypothetical protein [Tabrizicola thermarum]|uniref:hypothetical protein n=1 Tax=Tabrizicola thermarum TaxID=2670345 RepID=UPI000FFCB129|nr:hypothetical protein [Tabrizicola thermarum]